MTFEVLTFQQTPSVPDVNPKSPDFDIDKYKIFLSDFMAYVSIRSDALGLAANQLGENGDSNKRQSYRVFAMREGKDSPWEVIIAPRTVKSIGYEKQKLEGCLSWPQMRIVANRYPTVRVTYRNIRGELVENRELTGMLAQVWQHEINHLNGIPEEVVPPGATIKRTVKKVGRNDPCPCGKVGKNGKPLKFKKCCGSS